MLDKLKLSWKKNPQLVNEILKKNFRFMGSDLKINSKIQEYILNNGLDLHSVQKEIITHNESLGDIKRMQISISQSQFLHLIVKFLMLKKY